MYDVVVIGGGIAGLSSAITSYERGFKTAVLYKKEKEENNSFKAQGGVSIPVYEEDSAQSHYVDTINAGKNLNCIENTHFLIHSAQDILKWLNNKGVFFNDIPTKEAAHSYDRVLHIGDITGREIHRGLSEYIRKNCHDIDFIEGFACDFSKDKYNNIYSLFYFNKNNDVKEINSQNFIISTGGIGGLFSSTSNSTLLTGDGIAMAWRAGIELCDMEFIQFHPTVFCAGKNFFLISESLRGEGGKIIDNKGNEFLGLYHEKAELAPRDIVSLGITDYMEKNNISNVYLDVRHLGKDYLINRFPNIYQYCLNEGFDIALQPVPVRPACHYFIGGIKVDNNGKTNIDNIYACGECAASGVHGANRLASNSLLECLVYGISSANSVEINKIDKINILTSKIKTAKYNVDVFSKKNELKEMNEKYIGIKRNSKGLLILKDYIDKQNIYTLIPSDQENLCLMNMYQVSKLIMQSALLREKSIGVHKRIDSVDNENSQFHTIINQNTIIKSLNF
ncbi:MAG: FAD-binding protein [Candidatus Muirbacterium halophilum]|nr:FAD-binding protein [Candidatus Muirbacterium halophilum]MCK9475049.1 FAD-binding protein [Candidatus Muirbacterium halophilum]